MRLGAAGRIMSGADATRSLAAGLDFVVIGRGAVLHHDFPARVRPAGIPAAGLPVTAEYLAQEGLSPVFVEYMRNWKGPVASAA